MFCASIYENIGVAADAPLSVRVSHSGLAQRSLTTASQARHVFPTTTTENLSVTDLQTSISALRERLVESVMQVLEPMFMLFDFKRFDRKVYEEIVRNFVAGRVS